MASNHKDINAGEGPEDLPKGEELEDEDTWDIFNKSHYGKYFNKCLLFNGSREYLLYNLINKLCHNNNNNKEECEKQESYNKWLMLNYTSPISRQILAFFWQVGATTFPELEEKFKVSQQTYWHLLQGMKRFGIVERTNFINPKRQGPGVVVWALSIAIPEASAKATRRCYLILNKQNEEKKLAKEKGKEFERNERDRKKQVRLDEEKAKINMERDQYIALAKSLIGEFTFGLKPGVDVTRELIDNFLRKKDIGLSVRKRADVTDEFTVLLAEKGTQVKPPERRKLTSEDIARETLKTWTSGQLSSNLSIAELAKKTSAFTLDGRCLTEAELLKQLTSLEGKSAGSSKDNYGWWRYLP